MTLEQKQVYERCKRILKDAFPDLTGHFEFHLVRKRREVRGIYIIND